MAYGSLVALSVIYYPLVEEISRKVLRAPSSGRLLLLYFAGDAPGDGG